MAHFNLRNKRQKESVPSSSVAGSKGRTSAPDFLREVSSEQKSRAAWTVRTSQSRPCEEGRQRMRLRRGPGPVPTGGGYCYAYGSTARDTAAREQKKPRARAGKLSLDQKGLLPIARAFIPSSYDTGIRRVGKEEVVGADTELERSGTPNTDCPVLRLKMTRQGAKSAFNATIPNRENSWRVLGGHHRRSLCKVFALPSSTSIERYSYERGEGTRGERDKRPSRLHYRPAETRNIGRVWAG